MLDRGDHGDENGGRALGGGLRETEITLGLGALTTGRMAAHHTHTHISLIAVDTHAQPL